MPRDLKIKLFRATVEPILLYGSECWALNSSLQKSLDGTYTRMLRTVLNTSWQDHITNEVLYGDLPRVTDRVAWRRMGLVGHCYRHKDILASHLVLWEPIHGYRRPGRPASTLLDTLKGDAGAADTAELAACMLDRENWTARRAARLRVLMMMMMM